MQKNKYIDSMLNSFIGCLVYFNLTANIDLSCSSHKYQVIYLEFNNLNKL